MNNRLQSSLNYQKLKISFKFFNLIALCGWVVLIGLPFWEAGSTFVVYVAVSSLALIYGYLLYLSFKEKSIAGEDRPGFLSLRGVVALFQNPTAALAAWVHILAFDLMVGVYIQQEGSQLDISHWLLIPCYILTLIFGPFGLLLFLIISNFVV